MYNTPTTHRFNKSDFDEQIFPLLTCMSAYHSSLRTSKVLWYHDITSWSLFRHVIISIRVINISALHISSVYV